MKKAIAVFSALFLIGNCCVFAADHTEYQNTEERIYIQSRNIAITDMESSLSITSSVSAQCIGKTTVSNGYKAKVKVELQRKDGSWSTIKTWTTTGDSLARVSKSYSVSSGYQYRVKATHYALTSSGSIVESYVSYSSTATY